MMYYLSLYKISLTRFILGFSTLIHFVHRNPKGALNGGECSAKYVHHTIIGVCRGHRQAVSDVFSVL